MNHLRNRIQNRNMAKRTTHTWTTRVLVSILSTVVCVFTATANANETCGELFQSQYEGVLGNTAAKVVMISKLRNTLPAGAYNVRATVLKSSSPIPTKSNLVLGITYSGPDGAMIVRLGSTYLLNGNPLDPGTMIQLLSNSNIAVSGKVRFGDPKTFTGETVREARIEFTEKQDGTVVLLVTEATTNRSVYRQTPTKSETTLELEVLN